MTLDLKSKVAVVTGSARGIGKAIATKFAQAGAKVVITDINVEQCEETAKEIAKLGVETLAIGCNVTKKDEVNNLMNKTKEKFGSIDIIVNNAGVTRDGLFVRMKEEDWDLVLNINLKGTFLCAQAAGTIMMKQRKGKIINIASVSGIFGNAGQANYASSKAGVIGLTKVIARELAGRNVNCNAIAPGFIKTDMTDKLSDEIKANVEKQIPLGKMGTVEDISNVALFLASEESNYMTGQVLSVCGGLVM
ncbi:MAG: 3-oxoacyl-[acyl-carrier-protein] reductase [Candidatus Margulisbacteria bacterium]|nr:3-oxoacyl-[acyl-carrier-protein] reductase [Candidatus Margulisiibacteriota bacterium]